MRLILGNCDHPTIIPKALQKAFMYIGVYTLSSVCLLRSGDLKGAAGVSQRYHLQTECLGGATLAGVGRDEHFGGAGEGGAQVDGVHAAQRVLFQSLYDVLDDLGRGIADQRIGDVEHQGALDDLVLRVRQAAFPLQAAEGGDQFRHGDDRQRQFAGPFAPRQYVSGAGFVDVALGKGR